MLSRLYALEISRIIPREKCRKRFCRTVCNMLFLQEFNAEDSLSERENFTGQFFL
jgi:hypothetical protein